MIILITNTTFTFSYIILTLILYTNVAVTHYNLIKKFSEYDNDDSEDVRYRFFFS